MSGRLLLDWIDNETEEGIQDDPETLKTIFDATDFFVAGASVAENKVSGSKLLKEIDALPPKYTTGVYDKAELVLTKIPGHLQDKHWVQNMHYELRKAKRARAKAPSLTDMCGDITDELKKAEPSPSANTASRAEDKAKSPKVDNGARAKRMAGQMLTGTIDKWMGPDSSFSFIAFDGDGKERVFVHKSAIKGDKPAKGDKVRFKIIAETRKGVLRECAANVSLAKDKLVANAAAVQTEEDGGDVDYGATSRPPITEPSSPEPQPRRPLGGADHSTSTGTRRQLIPADTRRRLIHRLAGIRRQPATHQHTALDRGHWHTASALNHRHTALMAYSLAYGVSRAPGPIGIRR